MSEMAEKHCQRCGKPLSPDVLGGLCPACLMTVGDSATTAGMGKSFEPPAPSELARLFPALEIIELLGRGGMGAVYKARQPKLDRYVALKLLTRVKDPKISEAEFTARFQQEARALARLAHPDIVAVHDFGEAGGYHCLLMEYVDGVTLRQLLRTQKLSPEQALKIVPKICEALQFAHERGIVHRDIKPENILLDKEGRVKIADFGIAKIVEAETRGAALTGAKDVIGTPHYMAPEQVEKPQTVDHRADIYSLGVVFYEMLTGELPLGKFQPPSKKVQVDVRLDEIVLHALEKEPERRYQRVSEVKSDVETIATTTSSPRSTQREEAQAGKAATILGAIVVGTRNGRRVINWPGVIQAWLLLSIVICFVFFLLCRLFGMQPSIWEGGVFGLVCGALVVVGGVVRGWSLPKDKLTSLDGAAPSMPNADAVSADETAWNKARQEVKAPATALFIIGCLNLGVVFAMLAYNHFMTGHDGRPHRYFALGPLLLLLVGYGMTLIGASRMRQLTSYGLAIAATIFAMIFPFGCIIGLPIGIWSLIVLCQRDVREAFGKARMLPPQTAQLKRSVRWKTAAAIIIALVFPVVGFLAMRAWNNHSQPGLILSGTVTEAATGKPLAGAYVADNRFGVTEYKKGPRDAWTDTNGNYTLHTWPEEHTIRVYAPDFENRTATLTTSLWERERTARMDFQLEHATNDSKFTFGPVIERVLNDPGTELKDCFLDADTGRVLSPPRELTESLKLKGQLPHLHPLAIADWARTNGVDFMLVGGETNLLLLEGTAIGGTVPLDAIGAKNFQPMTGEDLEQTAAINGPGFGTHCDFSFCHSWDFRTREGGCGVLEFVGFTENPRGVKIRYKLVQGQSQSKTAKRQRFVPQGGMETQTTWSLLPKPSEFNSNGWAVVAHIAVGGVVPVRLPGEHEDLCRIHLPRGDDDQLTVQIEDFKNESNLGVMLKRDQHAAIFIDGKGYRVSYPSIYVAADQPDTTPFAHVIVTPDVDAATLPNETGPDGFGPVTERVVNDISTGRDCFLNLETGELLSPVEKLAKPEEMQAWATKHEADLVAYQQGVPGAQRGLMLLCGISVNPPDWGWGDAIAESVVKTAEEIERGRANRPVAASYSPMLAGRNSTPSYVFKNCRGRVGILQILALTENPRGVKIRYKLVEAEAIPKTP